MRDTEWREKMIEISRKMLLSSFREVTETSDINEAAKKLASGNWIAFFATSRNGVIKLHLGKL